MNCENKLCIYQNGGKCFSDTISLNDLGMCENCICIDIDPIELESLKASLRKKFEALDIE